MASFTGASGHRWTYDEAALLGPPGGFGRVHPGEGEDGREVAVKVIEVALRLEPEALFRREVEIGEKLRSGSTEYLLPALDWGSEGGELLIVLDKAEGSLLEHIAPAPLDVPATIEVLLDIGAGLEELHQASVVHRDLKPGNVLRHEGHWKLADFGISRDAELGTQSLTWKGAGSLAYMAPEMWALEAPTPKGDMYALGCVVHQLLTGAPPFPGPDFEDYRDQHATAVPPALPEGTPAALSRLVLRLLEKNPAGRPQDARWIRERLVSIAASSSGEPAHPVDLGEIALRHDTERAQAEATAAAAATDAKRLDDRRRAAADDLEELFISGTEAIRQQLDDVEYEWNGTTAEILTSNGGLEFHMVAGEGIARALQPAVALGSAYFANRRLDRPYLAGNIVREPHDEDPSSDVWVLYRFIPNALVPQGRYPFETDGREYHGMTPDEFIENRGYMRPGLTHIFRTQKTLLTPEVILRMFGDALELEQGWNR